jgi:hypothetical protein
MVSERMIFFFPPPSAARCKFLRLSKPEKEKLTKNFILCFYNKIGREHHGFLQRVQRENVGPTGDDHSSRNYRF